MVTRKEEVEVASHLLGLARAILYSGTSLPILPFASRGENLTVEHFTG